jgi:hypothetical protein
MLWAAAYLRTLDLLLLLLRAAQVDARTGEEVLLQAYLVTLLACVHVKEYT